MLKRHSDEWHTLGNHVCADCGKPYLTKYHLKLHETVVLKAKARDVPRLSALDFQVAHDRIVLKEVPSLNGLIEVPVPDKKKVRITRDFFPCSCCGEHFSDRAKVWRHMNYNHGTGHFKCPKCPGESCIFPADMTDHVKNFHLVSLEAHFAVESLRAFFACTG